MDKDFDTNLLRFIGAELYFSLSMQTSREMYAKGYFSLGVMEKAEVDRVLGESVMGNYHRLVAQVLNPAENKNPVGFQAPDAKNSEDKK